HDYMGHEPELLKAVRLWDTRTGKPIRTLLDGKGGFYAIPLAFSPDGKVAAVGMGGPDNPYQKMAGWDVKLWDVAQGRETRSLPAPAGDGLKCIAFSPDGKHIAAGLWWGVQVWDRQSGNLLWSHSSLRQRWHVLSIALSADNQSVLAAGNEIDFLIQLPARGSD